ncbi:hypothetical protein [Candidatus Accumulibacter sp. ACC012]|uniref:hypothetical protein n=1 Tax=Candidatus Accumulibacter sp. ACC012 TaxID=2823332 RepID=UPI0025BA7246|nr:hypothetical protein [Candidatus Accumulibacter sp. ACC012]
MSSTSDSKSESRRPADRRHRRARQGAAEVIVGVNQLSTKARGDSELLKAACAWACCAFAAACYASSRQCARLTLAAAVDSDSHP